MKKVFSLFVAALMAVGAMAQNVETADFTAQGYENGQAIESYVGESFSIAFDKGTNKNNPPKYYNTGTAIRCYGANTMTFTSSNAENFTSIVFTFGSGDGSNEITANVGKFENNTWTGAADEVVFTIDGTSGHRRIQAVEVTIEEGTVIPTEEETRTLYLVPGEEWTLEGAQYAIYYSDEAGADGWSDFMDEAENETSIFAAEIPAGYTNVIFVVFNQSVEEPDWQGMTAQTVNLTIPAENDMFTIGSTSVELNGKYEGTWSKYVYVEPCKTNYGLNINDTYIPGELSATAANVWIIKNVTLHANDILETYDYCNGTSFVATITDGADLFNIGADKTTVKEDGVYSFTLTLSQGNDKLAVVKEEITYNTCAEANAAEKDTEVTLGAFDVVYVSGVNIYIKDASGMTQIYKSEYGLEAGDHVEAGLKGKVTIYNNNTPEVIPSTAYSDLQISDAGTISIDDAQDAPVSTDVNYILMYRGVALVAGAKAQNYVGTFNDKEFNLYDKGNLIESLDENVTYTIKGLVGFYKSNLQVTILDITADEGSCVQTYGLMVGNDYVRGRLNEASGQWEMKNVKLKANDVVKLYDYCNATSFKAKNFEKGSDYFDIDGDDMKVKEEGVYSFYLTLQNGNDVLTVEKEVVEYKSSADVNTAEDGTVLTLGEFVVVYVNRDNNGQYIYIQDANGMTLIYFKGQNDYGLKAGDRVAAGMEGKVTVFNKLPEFVPTTAFEGLTIEDGEVPALTEATGAPVMEDINKMFIYRDVTLGTEDGNKITGKFKGQDIVFYDRFNLVDLTAAESVISRSLEEKTYTITGCVSVFKDDMQVYIAAIEEETGSVSGLPETMLNSNSSDKVMVDGVMYIIRDGKLYNAQGVQVR